MNATAPAAELPNPAKQIGKAILTVLNHGAAIAIFCFACLAFELSSTISARALIDAWYGGLTALLVLVSTIIITLVICSIIKHSHKPKYKWQTLTPYDDMLNTAWGWWITLGPAFATLAVFAFIFYPVEKSALVINGEKVSHWTWANPWKDKILYVNYHQNVSTRASALCKWNLKLRGDVAAEFVLMANPKVYLSNDELQKRAGEELARCFEETVSKMQVQNLQHALIIELGVGEEARFENIGLQWKPGSVIVVSNIHGAPPGS